MQASAFAFMIHQGPIYGQYLNISLLEVGSCLNQLFSIYYEMQSKSILRKEGRCVY